MIKIVSFSLIKDLPNELMNRSNENDLFHRNILNRCFQYSVDQKIQKKLLIVRFSLLICVKGSSYFHFFVYLKRKFSFFKTFRTYAEEIENRLVSSGIRTSIRLLREDVKLTDAIENARTEQCLYGIIAMPMHEDRRTASFHILYGQTEGSFSKIH